MPSTLHHEHLIIPLDGDCTALIRITIQRPPAFPTPLEADSHSVPTAREFAAIISHLAQNRFQFAPISKK